MPSLTPNNWLVDFIFPSRLHRVAYFVRLTLANIATGFLCANNDLLDIRYFWACFIGLLIYSVFFIVRSRIRDIGMSQWWILLCFIPVADIIFGLILAFRAPRFTPASMED